MFKSSLASNQSALPSAAAIRLRDFYEQAVDTTIKVDNSKVYLPDPAWTRTFAAGLQKCDFSRSHIIEAGVGSGVNMAGLMLSPRPPKDFIGVDIAAAAIEASSALKDLKKFPATLYESDLLDALSARELRNATHIIGCIPQVPRQSAERISEREKSDYYETTGIKEDEYGLGLIARLLDQSAKRAPQADLILNIAGRPGGTRINEMFGQHGFKTDVVHKTVVRQDAGTCLASLVEIEKRSGLNFHFYGDNQAKERINAQEAETRRREGTPIYHNLYVLKAHLG